MSEAEEFIAVANSYIGTPFHHGGRLPGVGLDCIGVLVCAALSRGYAIEDMPAYPLRANGQLIKELRRQFVPVRVSELAPGDILMMSFESEPHHIALYAGDDIIHSYAQVRRCVRQPFVESWREKVRGAFRLPELVDG